MKLLDTNNRLEYYCDLNFTTPIALVRLTGIICTIGPSSRHPDIIEKMIAAGMNIARINFSHGNFEYHTETIRNIREAVKNFSQKTGRPYPIAIAMDTRGPEIRTGLIDGSTSGEVELKSGETIKLTTSKDMMERGNKDSIYIDYGNIVNVLKVGNKLYVDDGAVLLVARDIQGDTITCVIETGGMLGSRKAIVMPGVPIDLQQVSEKDKGDLKFGIEQDLDIIFASNIKEADTLGEIRQILGDKGKNIKIVTKIDSKVGLNNLDELINASDGIIVARGDLGIEMTPEKVYLAQKTIMSRCNRLGKPVICAMQLFESMIKNLRPNRAEVTDVASAILDGADCVMLSGETSIGDYPLECTLALARTCKEVEAVVWNKVLFADLILLNPSVLDAAHSCAIAAVEAVVKCKAACLVNITTSGRSSYLIAKYRPPCPIFCVTRYPQTARQSNMYRGIFPLIYTQPHNPDWLKDIDNRVNFAIHIGQINGIVNQGDQVVVVTGWKQGTGFTNTVRIVYAIMDDNKEECMYMTSREINKSNTK